MDPDSKIKIDIEANMIWQKFVWGKEKIKVQKKNWEYKHKHLKNHVIIVQQKNYEAGNESAISMNSRFLDPTVCG